MKRVSWLLFGILITVFITGSAAAADDFCMDCIQHLAEQGDRVVVEAQCCMALGGHCYIGDEIKQENVGSGCKISTPDEHGATSCASTMEDKGCPPGGGGGNHHNPYGTFAGDGNPCVYDSMGWCDSACGSCTWG